ncbi:hypothetical protein ANCCAN_02382 [Ancylostoma caninum]|uniref:ZSWIM3 N-terminal domain-containing protein n=1 Tax=Ancylostoma caninum TaxID=29170 RepID=A0A368H498_ANCCA|nr:hypothetical protein ANCCAN_02382 [Ancylostoma caninum]
MTSAKSDQSYGVEMYGFSDFVHVPTKKAHYDAWSSSTGSTSGCSSSCSPNHLEELHVDIPHSSTASVASTSNASHSSPETAANAAVRAPVPTFTDLKPILRSIFVLVSPKDSSATIASALARASEVLANGGPGTDMTPGSTAFPATPQPTYLPVAAPDVVPLAPKPIYPNASAAAQSGNHPVITHDARFSSYAEFDEAFEAWKRECLHPFRVASSETLREPDGTVNHRFKYRYVVFHCAHYGEPRMRGIGKRPNQHYLPSGCRAMLRLNYSFSEQLLKITTLHDEHLNHEVSAEMFRKVSAKLKRSSCGGIIRQYLSKILKMLENCTSAPSPVCKRSRLDSPSSLPHNMSSPSVGQPSPLAVNSPVTTSVATSGANSLAAQIMASLLNQQKENINLAANLSSLGIPRAQPSMLNILSMMGLQQRLLLQQQPAYGLVAPLTQQFSTASQAQSAPNTEGKPNISNAEQQGSAKNDQIAAPVALKPNAASASTTSQLDMSPGSSPPHLVAEAPVPASSEVSSNATVSPTATTLIAGSFEESLARFRSSSQDSEIMTRIAQLNSLSSFWGTPTISEFR